MLNPISQLLPNMSRAQPKQAQESAAVNNVFKVFHGFYGNLFLMKFATGQLDATGQDMGVISARQIWAHGLREFDGGTVKTALSQSMERNPEFPPSLPQLVALCKANQPRKAYAPAVPEIAMGQALRSEYAKQARAINARHAQQAMERRLGAVYSGTGLDGLKQAIANAVGAAGGDEVAELRRLDLLLSKRAA